MCGRFVSTHPPDRIASYFGASFDEVTAPGEVSAPDDGAATLDENFNVAPTNDVYGVVADREEPGARAVRLFRWGLVPSWAKDTKIGSKMINARSETITEKPAFKKLFSSRRVLIPMDGFYEWKVVPGQKAKQPMYISRPDGELLAVAGLWSAWRDKEAAADDPEAPWLHTCTVITTSANATMAPAHDRMPVMVPANRWQEWLDPDNHDIDGLRALLVPAPDDLLTMHAVSTAVNNVRNKGPELVEPVEASGGQLLS